MAKQTYLLSVVLIVFALTSKAVLGGGATRKIYKKLLEVDAKLSEKLDNVTRLLLDRERKVSTTCHVTCQPVCQPNEMCFNFDSSGAITGTIPGVSIQSPMTSLIGGKPCSRQIVLKVHFLKDSTQNVCLPDKIAISRAMTSISVLPPQRMLKIQMYLSNSERYNYMFNIGDSQSNNGHGGDGSHQSYDSEVYGRNKDIAVYGSDHCLGLSSNHPNAMNKPASLVNVWVRNSYVKMTNDNGLLFSNCSSPCLFGLGGQNDSEGQENEDIYIAANRVISGSPSDRVGHGLCFMKLRWVSGSNE